MSINLIERARKARTSLGESLHFGLCAELADCVEKLEAENAALRQQVDEAENDRKLCYACKTALDEANDALYKRQGKPTYDELRQQVTLLRGQQFDHSCHDDCTVPGCVNRRLREQLADLRASKPPPTTSNKSFLQGDLK